MELSRRTRKHIRDLLGAPRDAKHFYFLVARPAPGMSHLNLRALLKSLEKERE